MCGAYIAPVQPYLVRSSFHQPVCPDLVISSNMSVSNSSGYSVEASQDSLKGIFSFVGSLMAGQLSDVHGRKTVIMVGLLGNIIPYLALTATCLSSWFVILNVAAGLSSSAVNVGILSYIADCTRQDKRTAVYGYLSVCSVVFLLVASPLGGLMSSLWKNGQARSFYFSAFVLACLPLLVSFFLKEPAIKARAYQQHQDCSSEEEVHAWKPYCESRNVVMMVMALAINMAGAAERSF
ncbi:hypothetical protein GUITHDRAFT_119800 [Guillardia theta CCMP2712]|uniref:Major facilitator superfamily (MFS) profile domain-containing protein n=1 Tax=Guillardia theta (strain CCMP2712) TaxID=905079 RepID=L1IDU5_GUITC|nr:hypothetical protein GUITHDRAFT_119800 [Guillardia theta CCMP2712]EKX34000.1 hypothetical protein GUITHDRAFT_119800 [Guillardia theta CCMP2712]|eukprot:XP_005820980.1 hypothetical protein GUITHDRAFT_119800 [Guillardia theta CCMP2712]